MARMRSTWLLTSISPCKCFRVLRMRGPRNYYICYACSVAFLRRPRYPMYILPLLPTHNPGCPFRGATSSVAITVELMRTWFSFNSFFTLFVLAASVGGFCFGWCPAAAPACYNTYIACGVPNFLHGNLFCKSSNINDKQNTRNWHGLASVQENRHKKRMKIAED
jgi:hypothetical protein